jgi:multisubunit Na+/H+ antiporter MnhF subunit
MAKTTIVVAILLIALGVIGFVGTGSAHPTALIPAYVGAVLAVFGALAQNPDAGKRKLYMHINVTVALLGFLGTVKGLYIFLTTDFGASAANPPAVQAKAAMAILLLVYVGWCVRSFIAARRSGAV